MAERLAEVRERISRAGAGSRPVTVVAVTKGFGPATVEAAARAGLMDLGENYAQELVAKAVGAPPGVRWHFLGALQANKLARLARHVQLWHGLDRQQAATELARRCPGAAVLVQVRLPGSSLPRRGADVEEVPGLVEVALGAGLDVRGLMTLGRPGAEPEEARAWFHQVAGLAARLGLRELSMGMSADFELAVAEGATIVRLGQVLFGPRPPARSRSSV